jgi:hypothetical protein
MGRLRLVQPCSHTNYRRLGCLDLAPSTIATLSYHTRNDDKQHEHLHDETRHEKERLTGDDSIPALKQRTGGHISHSTNSWYTTTIALNKNTHILVSLHHHIRHSCPKTERENKQIGSWGIYQKQMLIKQASIWQRTQLNIRPSCRNHSQPFLCHHGLCMSLLHPT